MALLGKSLSLDDAYILYQMVFLNIHFSHDHISFTYLSSQTKNCVSNKLLYINVLKEITVLSHIHM